MKNSPDSPAWILVKDDVIVNAITWDGLAPYTPPDGCALIDYADAFDIGWAFVDGKAVMPEVPQ